MKLVTCLAPFYWSTIDPYSSLKFQIFSYTCIIENQPSFFNIHTSYVSTFSPCFNLLYGV